MRTKRFGGDDGDVAERSCKRARGGSAEESADVARAEATTVVPAGRSLGRMPTEEYSPTEPLASEKEKAKESCKAKGAERAAPYNFEHHVSQCVAKN